MATIFSRIVAGEIPCHKIAEDDEFFAFLDINPVAVGHTLVIPKKEVDYIFDIDDPMLGRMMAFAKRVAQALETAIECKRVGLAVMGLEVPHSFNSDYKRVGHELFRKEKRNDTRRIGCCGRKSAFCV